MTTTRCLQCHVAKLPSYNISNLLTSDISRLLSEKANLYKSERCRQVIVSFKDGNSSTKNLNQTPIVKLPSIQLISEVHVEEVNEAHERFSPTLKYISSELDRLIRPELSSGVPKLDDTLLECIAKLLNNSCKEIYVVDRKHRNRLNHDVKSEMFYMLLREYIRFLHKTKKLLSEKLSHYNVLLESASRNLDSYYLNLAHDHDENDAVGSSDQNDMSVDKLKDEIIRLQKIKLIGSELLGHMTELIQHNAECVFDLD